MDMMNFKLSLFVTVSIISFVKESLNNIYLSIPVFNGTLYEFLILTTIGVFTICVFDYMIIGGRDLVQNEK